MQRVFFVKKYYELENYPKVRKRLNLARWNPNLPKSTQNYMILSDEIYFYLTLPSKNQNNRPWTESNHSA